MTFWVGCYSFVAPRHVWSRCKFRGSVFALVPNVILVTYKCQRGSPQIEITKPEHWVRFAVCFVTVRSELFRWRLRKVTFQVANSNERSSCGFIREIRTKEVLLCPEKESNRRKSKRHEYCIGSVVLTVCQKCDFLVARAPSMGNIIADCNA